jgi:FkbM family methyltransferase
MISVQRIEERSRAGARALYLGGGTVLAVVLGNVRMVLDSRDRGIVPHLALDGFWESWVTAWVASNVQHGERAINIGANCGYYTMLLARCVGPNGKVVAVEPNETHVHNIQHSAHLNGFHSFTRVVQAVASAEPGILPFNACGNGMTMNSHVSMDGNANTRVRAVRADDEMPDATFALIDTEGHEPLVWAGMQRMIQNHNFRAVIEWSPMRYSQPAAFYEKLIDDGFACSYIAVDGNETSAPRDVMLDGVERMVVLRRRR